MKQQSKASQNGKSGGLSLTSKMARNNEKKGAKIKKNQTLKKNLIKSLETNGNSSSETIVCTSPLKKMTKKRKDLANKKDGRKVTSEKESKLKNVGFKTNSKKATTKTVSKDTKPSLVKTGSKSISGKKSKSATNQKTKTKKGSAMNKEQKSLMTMFENDANIRPRGPRLASLNASCKMQLLYEVDRFQGSSVSEYVSDSDTTDSDDDEKADAKTPEKAQPTVADKSKLTLTKKSLTVSKKKPSANDSRRVVKKEEPVWSSNELLTDDESDEDDNPTNSEDDVDSIESDRTEHEAGSSDHTDSEDETKNLKKIKSNSKREPPAKGNKKMNAKLSSTTKKRASGSKTNSKANGLLIKTNKSSSKTSAKEPAAKNRTVSAEKLKRANEKSSPKRGRKPKEKEPKATTKKRKIKEDPSVQLIDTRSVKRMASLNASAMMTASMQNEKPMSLALVKASPSVNLPKMSETKPKNDTNKEMKRSRLHSGSVEVIRETKTTVIGETEMTETIQTIKQVRQMNNDQRPRDAVLSIEMLDPSHPSARPGALIEHLDNGIVEEPSSDDDIDERLSRKSDNFKKKKSSSSASARRNDGAAHAEQSVSQMTTTTKVKINKRRSGGDKSATTVEHIEYEVQHGAFNPFGSSAVAQSVSSLRSAAANQIGHPNASPKANGELISLTQQPFATSGYNLGSNGAGGYCVYPAYGGNPFDLSYHAAAVAAQMQSPNISAAHSTSTMPSNVCPSFMPNVISSNIISPSVTSSLPTMDSSDSNRSNPSTSVSYKSAFSVPQTTSSTFTTPSTSASVSFTPRMNGIYQLPNSPLFQTDSSYLIHKPVVFNAATGSPIFATTNAQYRPPGFDAFGSVFHNSLANPVNPHPTQMVHPAMQYLSPQLMPSYIFQYASPPMNSPAAATATATAFNQPLLNNPYLQSGGLVTQVATDLSQMNNPVVSSSGSGAAVNIAFIPGLQTQLGALNGTGMAGSTLFQNSLGTPSLLLNSNGQMSSHNVSAVPNLVNAAAVSAGQPTAAANPNIDQQPCNISNEPIVTTQNFLPKTSKSTYTKSGKHSSSHTASVNLIGSSTSKDKSKSISAEKSGGKKSVDNVVSQSILNGGERTNDTKRTSVELLTVSEPKKSQNSAKNAKDSKNAPKSVSPVLSTSSSSNHQYQANSSSASVSKSKSFAVGIRKNRNVKKSKTLSISGCSIEVGSGGQTSTTLSSSNLLTTQPSRNSIGLPSKSFLPGLAPEPESGNSLLRIKANGSASNWVGPKTPVNEKSNSKCPVTTIYLSEQSKPVVPKVTVTSKNNAKPISNGSTIGSLDGSKVKMNSNALTITPLSVSSSKPDVASYKKSALAKSTKSKANNLSTSKTSGAPLDVLIVSGSKPTNDSSKSNGIASKVSSLLSKQPGSVVTSNLSLAKKHAKSSTLKTNHNRAASSANLHSTTSASSLATDPYTAASPSSSSASLLAIASSLASLSKVSLLASNTIINSPSTVSIATPFTSSFSSKNSSNPIPAAHGWTWEGKPSKKPVVINPDEAPQFRLSYPRIKHSQGDVISERDCVLLRSGTKCTDLPFVAKISAFWEEPSTKAMMMSLLWYYRPEHTERMCNVTPSPSWSLGTAPSDEIYASKHRDVNSVACIDDKCHVLTFAQFCRYRKRQKMLQVGLSTSLTDRIVPPASHNRNNSRMPPLDLSHDSVLCCRRVYDFRQKRLLKNPT